MKQKSIIFCLLLSITTLLSATNPVKYPKREFRGAWMQTVNSQFRNLPAAVLQQRLIHQLDEMQLAGINAIIFQVRPEADAFYASQYEPWSRYLTGAQGEMPNPVWDPMQFMIEQCHARNMEFHAWVNPYRVKTSLSNELAPTHIYFEHPEWFVTYGNQLFFNPAFAESRSYICKVITDIVSRYDVDGIHMDDYFYPYPKPGVEFDDELQFQQTKGDFQSKGDWRRNNVNLLVRDLQKTIKGVKPWVKFGISPFGIYRNKKSDPLGSDTNGLENYDDLYADVLLWAKEGWVDYLMPQIYWHIGHPAADYATLVEWWAKHSNNRPIIIGQSITNTIEHADPFNPNMNQLPRKMAYQRAFQPIIGSCMWYSTALVSNWGRFNEALKLVYHKYPALMPTFDFIDDEAPKKVSKVKPLWTSDGYLLFWTPPTFDDEMNRPVRYVIYRFEKGEKVDIEDPSHIVATTDKNYYKLPYNRGKKRYKYAITALDRMGNESKSVVKKVKL